jgi:hypothetical protein
MRYPFLFLFTIAMIQFSYSQTRVIKELNLKIYIPNSYTLVNKENVDSIFSALLTIKSEPEIEQIIDRVKKDAYLFTLDKLDPLANNILINKMEGYSRIDSNLIPKVKKIMESINSFTWDSVSLIKTVNNIIALKLSGYIDYQDPKHKNLTFWIDDAKRKRLIAISFNNIPTSEIDKIVNSIKFYE